MTPEKENQLASRILERAELAQMTRQLRLNLGRASEKRKGDPEITEAMRKVSPKKALDSTPQQGSSSLKKSSTPSPPLSSASQASLALPVSQTSRDSTVVRYPATPKPARDDDVGADLLMYLATSPCASTTTNTNRKPPSTPNGFSPDDSTTTHPSHLKNSNPISSPFKFTDSPMLYTLRGQHPTTPGRSELRFNMGDYVHNLFSPSPGVNRAIHATPLSMEKTNNLNNNSPGGHLKPGRIMRREDSLVIPHAPTTDNRLSIDSNNSNDKKNSSNKKNGSNKNNSSSGPDTTALSDVNGIRANKTTTAGTGKNLAAEEAV